MLVIHTVFGADCACLQVLNAFKTLHRTRMAVFKDDEGALTGRFRLRCTNEIHEIQMCDHDCCVPESC